VASNEAGHRSIFYIGTDKQLYSVNATHSAWSLSQRQNDTVWPAADEPQAQLSVTSDTGSGGLRVYYVSGGKVIQVDGDGGIWQKAAALPDYNVSAPITTPTPTPTPSAASTSPASGLSTGAKAGVGVGVSLAAIAIAGMIGAWFYFRRRQRRRAMAQQQQQQQQQSYDYAGGYLPQGAYSQDAYATYGWQGNEPLQQEKKEQVQPGELHGTDAAQELSAQREAQEMSGEGHHTEAP
jgi:hypothetical protein